MFCKIKSCHILVLFQNVKPYLSIECNDDNLLMLCLHLLEKGMLSNGNSLCVM